VLALGQARALQVGLIGVLLQEFRPALAACFVYFVAFVAYAVTKSILIFGSDRIPEQLMWSDDGFSAAVIVSRLSE
jgi:hypothetical protein